MDNASSHIASEYITPHAGEKAGRGIHWGFSDGTKQQKNGVCVSVEERNGGVMVLTFSFGQSAGVGVNQSQLEMLLTEQNIKVLTSTERQEIHGNKR